MYIGFNPLIFPICMIIKKYAQFFEYMQCLYHICTYIKLMHHFSDFMHDYFYISTIIKIYARTQFQHLQENMLLKA